jgi:hypothetical protein
MEVVALAANGAPSFNVLQNYNGAATPLQFYVFDLLHLRGKTCGARHSKHTAPCCAQSPLESLRPILAGKPAVSRD